MTTATFVVCCFTTIDEIDFGGPKARRLYGAAADALYARVKAAVLEAGRFSVFDATQNMRAAHIFERLHTDPEIEISNDEKRFGFPWIGVSRRETPQEEKK